MPAIHRHVETLLVSGKVPLMTAMTVHCRGSLNGVRPSLLRRDRATGREHKERTCDEARRRSPRLGVWERALLTTPHPRPILQAPPCSVGCSPRALGASVVP